MCVPAPRSEGISLQRDSSRELYSADRVISGFPFFQFGCIAMLEVKGALKEPSAAACRCQCGNKSAKPFSERTAIYPFHSKGLPKREVLPTHLRLTVLHQILSKNDVLPTYTCFH
ncbi:hypothetical protein, unlikely [Trypanosoma brucei gambiense DAL972]|uniref:Uncharacterized protein n=1 Tax=Trypanosoma brucei gambiense (strain MHOM/CI/86/DAL972) TaxID=679716 RepID=C9ZU43_TRYB9|nr:hypothetical protein, unlikely [Trypanosoma brucei gambiense DAL972]CBH12929.1 hypothetical protein, unlikely [Trypanosoma brucei gambiense DAL972]|eukprot:XP_011775208.1 hypothetical protein, unlikely [Trypanosoma brucei gambiense DAL972]